MKIESLLRLLTPLALLLVSCGGAATAPPTGAPAPTVAATPTQAPTPTAAPTATVAPATTAPAVTAPPATRSWSVTSASKATVSVREQLVGVNLPSDAVLTATGAIGSFLLQPDGAFTAESKITFDVTTLASDSRDRDNFVKQSTLSTRQFPTATFAPAKATGLNLPLPTSGTFTFKLTGKLTIHGVTKDATFDAQARREGGSLTVTATANPTFTFGDFGMSAPSIPFRVVSVTDEIRLLVSLVATGPTT